MKSAIITAFKAFGKQIKANHLEFAVKTVEKNGFKVSPNTEIVKKAK